MSEFERWFDLWDQTKDPNIRRLCGITWNASRAYAQASGWRSPQKPPWKPWIGYEGGKAPLTEEKIIDRALEREAEFARWLAIGAFMLLALVAIWLPVHTFLHRHLEFLAGVLLGAVLQSIPWLVDRWHWMRWFSHQ